MKTEENTTDNGHGLGWARLYKKYGWQFFLVAIIVASASIYLAFFR